MPKRLAHFALMLVITSLTAISPAPASAPATDSTPLDAVARAPEVKLRKLHLVRPDLIPFPIFFEVYA